MAAKNTILRAKIEDVVYDMMVKTTAANVYVDDSTTLAAKLSAIIADIATKASTTELTEGLATKANTTHTHAQSDITGLTEALATLATSESVTSAIDALRQEMLGDTPVEAYNTFTELAAYISEHKEVSDALTAAVGNKADKATTLAGYGITDACTSSETDQKISDALVGNVFTIPITVTSSNAGTTDTAPEDIITAFNEKRQIVLNVDGQTLYPDSITVNGSEVTIVATYDFNTNNSPSGNIGYSTFTLNNMPDNSTLSVNLTQNTATGLKINDTTYNPFTRTGGTTNVTDTINSMIDAKISSATGGESAASVKAALDSYKTSNDARVDALEADTHTHANKTVIDGITADDITAWNNKTNTKIYYSETQPSGLAEGDLWFAIV